MGKLREKMREDMIMRGFAQNTMEDYVRHCRSFAKHFMRSPADMGRKKFESFCFISQRKRMPRPIFTKHIWSHLNSFTRTP